MPRGCWKPGQIVNMTKQRHALTRQALRFNVFITCVFKSERQVTFIRSARRLQAGREELIRSSVPVSTRVQEIEKREHVLAHEDVTSIKDILQRLLDMVRQTLLEIERKYGFLQRRNEKLEADLAAVTKELEMTRNNLAMYRRSGGSRRKPWKLNQEEVKELKEEVAVLNKELEKRDAIIENERTAHTAQLKDFIAAVKAAERNREEAQAKVSRMFDLNRTVVFTDDAIWEELMYKFQRSTQRNALLAWADAQ
ncbi:unnamed protein product [Heligmosomoides polygyrus]|uniref:BZIP domain-containing protein n=1 Tax=Heligmosomoides polygyrus TaxID=6339 RepID=A0A3P8B0U5_HELPZ|nr:unnamed protein product [Heligmosomoides polygyrus]